MVVDYEGTILFVCHDRLLLMGAPPASYGLRTENSFPFEGNLTAWEKKQLEARSEERMDKLLLELRLAEVIARLAAPNCQNKEDLEKEFERLAAQKNTR